MKCPGPPGPPRRPRTLRLPRDLLLDGLAVLVTDGRAAAAPMLRRVARIFAEDEIATEEGLRWGWVAATGTTVLWDVESSQSILLRQLQSAREAGLLVHLLRYVNMLGILATWCGQFAEAASLVAEGDAIAEATGTRLRAARGRNSRRFPGVGSRGHAADRGRDEGRASCRARRGDQVVPTGIGNPVQRSRPLREGPGRGPAGQRAGGGCMSRRGRFPS